MTNEDKAKEILSCHKCPFRTGRTRKIDIGEDACAVCFDYKSVMEMAKWKDEQIKAEKQALIDKACEWLLKLHSASQNLKKKRQKKICRFFVLSKYLLYLCITNLKQ